MHHVAWRAADDGTQLALREQVTEAGLDPTPVIDRNYFPLGPFSRASQVSVGVAAPGGLGRGPRTATSIRRFDSHRGPWKDNELQGLFAGLMRVDGVDCGVD
jgi:hypothetical protein